MTARLQAKGHFVQAAKAALAAGTLGSADLPLPAALAAWLARLRLLKGVPFAYLVPDEAMLPPESIRFFTLDPGWVEVLADGALSIGRTLGSQPDLALRPLEAAARVTAAKTAPAALPQIRARALGLPPAPDPNGPITGFLLRSRVVSDTPGMGVNVYPQGHTPEDNLRDPNVPIVLLDILRYETLGASSDVLICLVAGDAWQVDIHQPPEQLHYGIDRYDLSGAAVSAEKTVRDFTKTANSVTLTSDVSKVDISSAFRAGGQRVASMAALSGMLAVARLQVPPTAAQPLDAAEMGFEMTQGVGLVSFVKGGAK